MPQQRESWLQRRWQIWLDAVERRPPMILWFLGLLPGLYAFAHEEVFSAELQKAVNVPWWVWVVYYLVLGAIHFEYGVVARISEFEEEADASSPKFDIEIHRAWSEEQSDRTLVLLTTRIINHGAPSAVLSYAVKCKRDGDGEIPANVAAIFVEDVMTIALPGLGGHKMRWNPTSALPNQTEPIPTGGQRTGQLPILIDGHVSNAVRDGEIEITVTIQDHRKRESSKTFKGTGPAKSAMLVIGEQQPTLTPPLSSRRKSGKKKPR